jgi:prepilin-type N-terminal cleavage/methylation domain-containing protein
MCKHKTHAFTLVELIVVITILAILWTIAFISFQGFALSARESTRLNDIKTIEKSLWIYRINGNKLPVPDDLVDISFSGTILWKQWYAWTGMLAKIWQAGSFLDPSINSHYTYSTNDSSSEFQLLGYFEEPKLVSHNFFLPEKSYANTYENTFPRVFSSDLWIITETDNSPIMEDASLSWALDLALSLSEYKVFFRDDASISWSWSTILFWKTIFDSSISPLDDNLLFYFPFDDYEILDLSSNTFSWSLSWNAKIAWWKWKESLQLDRSDNTYLDLGVNASLLDPIESFSVSTWTKLGIELWLTNIDYYIVWNHSFDSMWFGVSIADISLPSTTWRIRFTTSVPWDRSYTLANNNSYPNDNKWHHLVFVKDWVDWKVYIDWSELWNYIIEDDMLGPWDSSNWLAIWASRASNSWLFPWNIDDMRMYSRALSSEEVELIHTKEFKN